MKTCSKCGVEKPITGFCTSKTIKSGYTNECKSCAAVRTRAYKQANRADVRARNKAYWLAHRGEALAYNREYVRAHPEMNAAHSAAWRGRHPEIAAQRLAILRAKWAGYKKPPAVANAQNAKRRAAKLRASCKWANSFFIQEAYALARLRTEQRTGGVAKWHVDHIVPLRSKLVCGLHVENNLQVIPASENHKKLNRYWPDMP